MEALSLVPLFRKRVRLTASTLRSRTLEYKVRLTQDFAAKLLPLFEEGSVHPVIDSTYDWSEVQQAHRRMDNNENAGKIILTISTPD